jgi:hypothetical protein
MTIKLIELYYPQMFRLLICKTIAKMHSNLISKGFQFKKKSNILLVLIKIVNRIEMQS